MMTAELPVTGEIVGQITGEITGQIVTGEVQRSLPGMQDITSSAPTKPKRVWRPWWLLPKEQQPICPDCNVACTVKSSPKIDGGKTTLQKRKCPKCGKTTKTTY